MNVRIFLHLYIIFLFSSCVFNNTLLKNIEDSYPAPSSPGPEAINDSSLLSFTRGPVIPGLEQGLIPQGLGYYEKDNLLIISNDSFPKYCSMITTISLDTGRFHSAHYLRNHDRSPHTGHVGGLTVIKERIWVASGKYIYYFDSDQLNKKVITLSPPIKSIVKASFATSNGNELWIGEYARDDEKYATDPSHHIKLESGETNRAFIACFDLDDKTTFFKSENTIDGIVYPDRIISIPDEVQGAAFNNDLIVLSQSYGSKDSLIKIYEKSELPKISTHFESPSLHVPICVLTTKAEKTSILSPPMNQEIQIINNLIYILSESGASKYKIHRNIHCSRIYSIKSTYDN